MIVIVGFGLVALAVLALAVGLFDAAQAGWWRGVARERRASWEQRRRDQLLALSRLRSTSRTPSGTAAPAALGTPARHVARPRPPDV